MNKATALYPQTRGAIAAILIAVFALSLSDAIIKLNGLTLPLWQLFAFRSALALPFLILFALRTPGLKLDSHLWVITRSLLLVAMWLCYYSALAHMSLSQAATGYYTAPIFITFFSSIFARKNPSKKVWFAILLGFVGVLLMLRPSATSFSWPTLLPIAAGILYALVMVLTTLKCRNDDPLQLTVVLNIFFVLSGLTLSLFTVTTDSLIFGDVVDLNQTMWLVLGALAVGTIIGSIGSVIAYQKGPPATIAACDYSYLVFALIWSALIFSDTPDSIAVLGMLTIVLAGFLALPKTR